MKKVQYMLAALCLAALTLSCQKTAKESEPAQTTRMITITGTIATELPDGTRVSIDNQGKTKWVEGDAIFFHGKYSANGYSATVYLKKEEISEDGKTFTVTIPEFTNGATQEKWADDYNSDSNIIAAYPAQAVGAETTSQNWYTINKFNTSNLPLMSGCNTAYDSCEFVFFNLCGIISFSVDQDFDSYIFMGNASEAVGYTGYQSRVHKKHDEDIFRDQWIYKGTALTSITGGPVEAGKTNYVCCPNGFSLSAGFTIRFISGGDITKEIVSNPVEVLVPRSKIMPLGDLSAQLKDYVAPATKHESSIPMADAKKDLGADKGTANCYFINPADAITNEQGSIFKFEAVKGNDTESVGNIASVEVLWRTFNNATTPGETDVVKAVDYDETGEKTYIVFQLPDTPQAGNAVIAARNAGGKILWSWHIWVPSTPIATIVDAVNLGPEMMTRNLGALKDSEASESNSVESFGFLYQWGRKDPFPGMGSITTWPSAAAVYGTGTTITTASEDQTITIETSIANPTKLALGTDTDWVTPSSSHLWESDSKTIYDPCPPGYKVPAWDDSKTFWSGNLGLTAENYNTTNGWFKLGDSVFPFAAYYYGASTTTTSLQYGGQRALYWSATAYPDSSSKSYCLFQKQGSTDAKYLRKRYVASVRCAVIAASE